MTKSETTTLIPSFITEEDTKEYIKDILTPEDYAAIYARKSNPMYSHSIESQIEMALEKAHKKNLIPYKIYCDEVSASDRAKRPRKEFEQLKIDIKLGKFKHLIVFKRDRLSRKLDELLEFRRFLREHEVELHFSDDHEYVGNEKDYYSDFIENIIMAISNFEPEMVTERTAAGKKAKWERREYCHGRYLPDGYESVVKEDEVTQYKPDEDKANLISKLFNSFVNSDDEDKLESILIELEAKGGFKSFDHYIKNPIYAGLQWKSSVDIRELFSYDEDTGEYSIPPKKKLSKLSNVTPIIDQDLYYKALLKWIPTYNPIKMPRHTYIFKGIAYCNECKKELKIKPGYYKCKERCTSIKVDLLEETLLEKIISDLLNRNYILSHLERKHS